MTNVIKYDFVKKHKISEHVAYQWVDALDGKTNLYDSRVKTNIEHFSFPAFLLDQKGNRVKVELFFGLDSFKKIYEELTTNDVDGE